MRAILFGYALLLLTGCADSPLPTGLRVAVIGLDGATFDLIEPWMDQGLLPNLAAMRNDGYSAELESVIPPLSAPAWTSAITGVNPGKHGIYDFELVDRDRFMPVPATALDRRAKAVWEYLTESERPSVIMTVPLTTPPDPIAGKMVGGFPHLRDTGYTWPPELEKGLGPWRLDRYGEYLPEGSEEAFLGNLIATREARFRAAIELFEEDDWELFWVVFMGTDKVQHFFWKFMEDEEGRHGVDPALAEKYQNTIRDFWIRIDEIVGEFLERADENTIVLVASDHGFESVSREMAVLKWLWNEGYCDTDFPRSRVLYFTHLGGRMTINTKSAFKRGVVDGGREYDDLIAELEGKLTRLVDSETGERVVAEVYRRDEIYSGPYLDRAPDLLFEPRPGFFFGRGSPFDGTNLFREPSFTFSGYHNRRGILIVKGPHVKSGKRAPPGERPRLMDLAPTLLRILGETVPRDMDGVPIDDLFTPGFEEIAPLREGNRSIDRKIPDERREKEREGLEALPYLG